jgi:membrane peptidoglycan carboxypeptidase
MAAGAAAIALTSALAFEVAARFVPLPPDLLRAVPATTTLVDSQGRMLASLATTDPRTQQPIALSAMGRWLPAVTIALEDRRFYEHAGIDWHASAAAIVRNLRDGAIVSGGSTITQQLIKLASRRTRRSWSAKLYENLAAVRLERMWSKDRILEEYLNRNHYGNRLIGPAAAARAYFHKVPAKLALAEAIYLAGLPQAPSRFNPLRYPAAAAAKHRRSVARLVAVGF